MMNPVSSGIVWKYGAVQVNGTPPGAVVNVSDGTSGIVPDLASLTLLNVTADHHQIEIKKEGYNPYYQEIIVTENQTTFVNYTLVLRPTGSLTVHSTPLNASLYLNGELKGMTPKVFQTLDPDTYHISVQTSGYQEWQSNISISAGDRKDIQADLIRENRKEETPGPGPEFIVSIIFITLVWCRRRMV